MTIALERDSALISGERDGTIVAMVTARAWRDAEYRGRLLSEPELVLAAEGLDLPPGISVRVVEDTEKVKYVNFAHGTTAAEQTLPVLRHAIPIPEGYEIRLVQSTDTTRYLVLPTPPSGIEPELMSEAELSRVALPTDVGIVVAVNAEAELSATTTTDIAEAEVVAVAVGVAVLL